ncbi:MAG TPA: prepilin peptidase, partial [Candidatus Limnocylindrales bacterium]
FAVYAVLFVALLVLLATDLDQRVLPDLITLPLIVFAAVLLIGDWSPALANKDLGRISGLAAGILAPVLLLVSDRVIGGDLGMGDVKLSISLGLIFGLSALFYGLLLASIGFAVVLIGLMAVRRLGMKSAVPFGPVLIFAAFLAALAA